jgi:predicted PurR-regulated permease PerM
MPDRVRRFFQEPTARRVLLLSLFLGSVVLFRHLLVLLVFFVIFERVIGLGSNVMTLRGMPRRLSVGLVAIVVLAAFSAATFFGVKRGIRIATHARETIPKKLEQLKQSALFEQVEERLPDMDEVVEQLQHYSASIFHAVSAFGHALIYALIGFILAIVFVLEDEEIRAFRGSIDPASIRGTLLRWWGHVADAMLVTVQFQCVVAAANAVLTLPVLLIVGIPHAPALAILIFVSGLVPVVGNFAMGAVLSLLAFQVKGWFGVGLFTVLTFVLHKLEAYYLNPRLAARHVSLPSFVLIVSLVLWEHMLGLVGLFVSFPFLYCAQRIRDELIREDAAAVAEATPALSADVQAS